MGRIAGDNEIRRCHHFFSRVRVGAFSINEEDVQYAICVPVPVWPAYEVFRREGTPGPHCEHKILDEVDPRKWPPTHPLFREAGVDPTSLELDFAGAAIPPQHEFRMMDANREVECPLVDSQFQVRLSPTRGIQRDGSHVWKMGVRVGPSASGARTNYATFVTSTPGALRKTAAQEAPNLSHAPGRIGFPAGITADAMNMC